MSTPIVANGSEQVRKLCEILEIPIAKCAGINIVIEPNDVIHAMVKIYVHDEQMDELNRLFQRHEWAKKDEPDPA